uniref:Uncharacterized protein n=1 Tax=Rhipicephalus zambeziensis TaxID=60191 RepID=A0A224YR07_9ACAR
MNAIATNCNVIRSNNNNNIWGLTSQNHDMIMRDAVVEGSGNFDHLGFFNVHLNLSTRASDIFASLYEVRLAAKSFGSDLTQL